MTAEVDTSIDESHALGAEAAALDFGTETRSVGDAAAVAHDAVPWDAPPFLSAQRAQCPADGAGTAADAEEARDAAVGRDSASGDGFDDLVHPREEALASAPWRPARLTAGWTCRRPSSGHPASRHPAPQARRAQEPPEVWC